MSKRNEILLTSDEIKEVEEKAKQYQSLRNPNLISVFGSSHKAIFNLSLQNGLILIQGNEDTGYKHICHRHAFYSRHNYWKLKELDTPDSYTLDTPTRFSPKSTAILDYIKIADKVYKTENVNNEKNKEPELFDMYSGKINFYDKEEIYHLLVYKNSKIIHTLYPNKSLVKRKKIKGFVFVRGNISVSHDVMNCVIYIKIPYFNRKKEKRYSIHIMKNLAQRKESTEVFTYNIKGDEISCRILDNDKFSGFRGDIVFEQVFYEYADLTELERILLAIENKSNCQL